MNNFYKSNLLIGIFVNIGISCFGQSKYTYDGDSVYMMRLDSAHTLKYETVVDTLCYDPLNQERDIGEIKTYDCNFLSRVSFSNCHFNAAADFKYSIFNKTAHFNSTSFAKKASFIYAKFKGTSEFQRANFQIVKFDGSEFNLEADLSGSTFKDTAFFRSTTFKQGAYFIRTKFDNTANFNWTQFWRDAEFSKAIFSNYAYFTHLSFGETAMFTFYKTILPDTIDFSNNNRIKNEINLLNADYTSPRHYDKKRDFYYKRHVINLHASDLSKFRFEYKYFVLDLRKLSYDERTTIYEGMLQNFKD